MNTVGDKIGKIGADRNIVKYMKKFASLYPDFEFVQQAVAQIPWCHTVRLMEPVLACLTKFSHKKT